MNKKVIFVVGPTASGKTALSIALAKKFGGEIISADSMQIYKGIHIASAAPNAEETEGIPHHLLEFLELGSEFSVADYTKLAKQKIEEILSPSKDRVEPDCPVFSKCGGCAFRHISYESELKYKENAVYTYNGLLAIKREEILSYAITLMNTEDVMLSERSHFTEGQRLHDSTA